MFLPQPDVLVIQTLLILSPLLQQSFLAIIGGIVAIIGAFILVIIGVLVIILIAGAIIFLLPAVIVGIIVWFLTGNFFYGGIAFLIIALISLVRRA